MFHSNHDADTFDSPVQEKSTVEMFLVNPRNEDFVRGRADKPAREPAMSCMLLFLVPFVLAGVLVATWTVIQWRDWVVLSVSSATTTGYFTDRSTSESDDSTTYHASYRYVVDDYEYKRKEQVSYTLYSRAEVGGSTQVLYFTRDPNIATLDLAYNNTLRLFLTVFALFWNGFIGILFFGGIRGIILNKKLAKSGRVTFGQITALTSNYDSDNDYHIEIKYAFESPVSGNLIRDKYKFQDNSRKGQRLPGAGISVAILFSSDKTYRLL